MCVCRNPVEIDQTMFFGPGFSVGVCRPRGDWLAAGTLRTIEILSARMSIMVFLEPVPGNCSLRSHQHLSENQRVLYAATPRQSWREWDRGRRIGMGDRQIVG